MKALAVWVACLLICASGLSAREEVTVEKEPSIHALAQELDGTIWGTPNNGTGSLYVRSPEGWQRRDFPGLEGFVAHSLQAARHGAIICLWVSGRGAGCALSRHRGTEPVSIVYFEGKLRGPRLVLGSDGAAVVTEEGPTVVRLDAAVKAAQLLTLPPELFSGSAKSSKGAEKHYAPTRAVQDDAGRWWFWSYALQGAEEALKLRGLVLQQEERFTSFPVAGLGADDPLSDVLPIAPHQLWVGRVGQGLWLIDTEQKTASAVSPPLIFGLPPNAFAYIEQLRTFGDDRYVVTCPQPTSYGTDESDGAQVDGRISLIMRIHYDRLQRTGALFRQRNGKWELLIDQLDEEPNFGSRERPWLFHPRALYIGAEGSGPWFIPAGKGKPLLINWRTGLPFKQVNDFRMLSGGTFLCLSGSGETAVVTNRPGAPGRPIRCELLKVWQHLFRDARGHIWMCNGTIQEWDGKRWQEHKLPVELAGEPLVKWVGDNRDRGWLVTGSGRVAVCNFANAQRQVFADLESAYRAQIPDGVILPDDDNPFLMPSFSRDGRCAFFQLPDRLSYFDGEKWRRWTTREIAGGAASVSGAPHFDGAGLLSFALGGQLHQWMAEQETWQARPLREDEDEKFSARSIEPSTELKEEAPVTDPVSVARDADGIDWIVTREGELKKLAAGALVSAFFEGERHPFRPGMKVGRVLADVRGNSWLELSTFGEFRQYLVLRTFGAPETKAELLSAKGDSAKVRFSSPVGDATAKWGVPSSVLFSWQLDGGPWQKLKPDPNVTLAHLSPGPHRLLVRAYGPSLEVDRTPAVVEWETNVDPEQQHGELLAELSAPTLARREAAAKAFRDQGAAAVPFLKAARAEASEDARWWIDAILQGAPKN